jgi:hypothetical protein
VKVYCRLQNVDGRAKKFYAPFISLLSTEAANLQGKHATLYLIRGKWMKTSVFNAIFDILVFSSNLKIDSHQSDI